MKNPLKNKSLVILTVLTGMVSFSCNLIADSAFSWGRWDGGEEMAVSMTAGQHAWNGDSLNHWSECLHGYCGQYKEPGQKAGSETTETLVSCQAEMANKPCRLGPKVSQQ